MKSYLLFLCYPQCKSLLRAGVDASLPAALLPWYSHASVIKYCNDGLEHYPTTFTSLDSRKIWVSHLIHLFPMSMNIGVNVL